MGVARLDRAGQHGSRFAACGREIERDLLQSASQPQHRSKVRFVENASRQGEQVTEALADQGGGGATNPSRQGFVGLQDATVRQQDEIAARRVLEEVLVIDC